MEKRSLSREAWLLFAGAALGSFLAVYWRALSYPPVFDDFAHVIENRAIRYLFHPRIFLESEASRARPLPYITFALSYWLGGLSLSWLRGASVLLHVANATLVTSFYRRWLGVPKRSMSWGAVGAGALFLLHPLAGESVIYLSARGSLLVLFFLLLALECHGREQQGVASWLGFLFFGLLAFLSRESAAALALLVIPVHWLSGRRHTELAPYFGPLLLAGLFAIALKASYLGAAWHGFFSIEGDVDVPAASDYIRLSLALWPRILELLVNPAALAIDHQVQLPASWTDPAVIAGIALWAGFAVCLALFFRSRSRWLFPVCWFFLALVPTNSVFPLLDPLSERHIYFALPAAAWMFGLAVDALLRSKARAGAVVAGAALLAVLVAGDTVTLRRVLTWSSVTELWLSAHRISPDKFRIAYNAATSLVAERGDREGALRTLAETLSRMAPGAVRFQEQSEGTQLLANVLSALAADRGETPRRIWASLGLPDGFWSELTFLRVDLGKIPYPRWEEEWRAAAAKARATPLSPRARDPLWVDSSFELLRAEALVGEKRHAEALAAYEKVILPFGDTHFPYWTARENLADLYRAAGREAEAVKQYELVAFQYKVFKRFPEDLQQKLYSIFRNRGDVYRATDAIGELVRVHTDDPELRRLYAELLSSQQDRHAARQTQEAEFYTRNAVGPGDDRELLRP